MELNISCIGSFALQVLERSRGARVSGIASRGIYLQPEDDLTLYLSLEEFPGPLTLNIKKGSALLEKIKAGCSARFYSGELQFPDQKITISLESIKIWHPPRVDNKLKSIPGHFDSILSLVNKLTPENPYLPLLSNNPGQIPGAPVIGERILNLQNGLNTGAPDKILDGAIKLLGLGPGLTPLGDDFLLGVLLTFNRWGQILSPDLPNMPKGDSAVLSESERMRRRHNMITDLNQIILENARLKTTQISTSLLTCAIEGAADERLIKLLDGLVSGVGITQNEIRNLLRWGNSSGITVLAGMISALKTKDTAPSE
jgi:hypothetical protein